MPPWDDYKSPEDKKPWEEQYDTTVAVAPKERPLPPIEPPPFTPGTDENYSFLGSFTRNLGDRLSNLFVKPVVGGIQSGIKTLQEAKQMPDESMSDTATKNVHALKGIMDLLLSGYGLTPTGAGFNAAVGTAKSLSPFSERTTQAIEKGITQSVTTITQPESQIGKDIAGVGDVAINLIAMMLTHKLLGGTNAIRKPSTEKVGAQPVRNQGVGEVGSEGVGQGKQGQEIAGTQKRPIEVKKGGEQVEPDINILAKKVKTEGVETLTPEEKDAWDMADVDKKVQAIDAIPIEENQNVGTSEQPTEKTTPQKSQAWEIGQERPFAFDPNSTQNEGRFRLKPPDDFDPNSYFRRKSSTEGISYVMGKPKEGGKTEIQAIRFDKNKISEPDAQKWWEQNKEKYEFAETPKMGEVAQPPNPDVPVAESDPYTTSVKNKIVNDERTAKGLPELETVTKQSHGDAWEVAKDQVAKGRDPHQLAIEIAEKSRPLKPEEEALLDYDRLRIHNDYTLAQKNLEEAINAKDDSRIAESRQLISRLEEEKDVNDRAAHNTGTDLGRGLAFRKALVKEDYSLLSTLQKALNEIKEDKSLSKAEVKAKLDRIRPRVERLTGSLEKAQKALDEHEQSSNYARYQKRLNAWKKRAEARYQMYAERFARVKGSKQIPEKAVKEPLPLDEEGQKIQANINRIKGAIDREILNLKFEQRGNLSKGLYYFNKLRRQVLISGASTLTKVISNSFIEPYGRSVERLASAGWAKLPIIKEVAKEAPLTGRFSLKDEVGKFVKGYREFGKDAYETMTTGSTTRMKVFGNAKSYPPEVIEFFGRLHGAAQQLGGAPEFEYALGRYAEEAIKNKQDISDPRVMQAIGVKSLAHEMETRFLNQNKANEIYKTVLGSLEKTMGGQLIGTAIRTELPIVKIPTNVAIRTFQSVFGLPKGLATIAHHVMTDGIESMTPEAREHAIRLLGAGSVGAVLIGIGYTHPNNFGGYWQPGEKRDPKDVQAGHLRFGDVNLPFYLTTNRFFALCQMGATMRRTMDYYQKKGKEGGAETGGARAILGAAQEIPFFETPMRLGESVGKVVRGTETLSQYAGEQTRDILIPPEIQRLARAQDSDNAIKYFLTGQGQATKRQAKSFKEEIETGVPGLRKNVPKGKSKYHDISRNELIKNLRSMKKEDRVSYLQSMRNVA